jgi:hypothetical protein
VDSIDLRPSKNAWMHSFLLLLKNCSSSCVVVLSNVCFLVFVIDENLYGVYFFSILCLIYTGQSYALNVSVCSGVAFQPANCIV